MANDPQQRAARHLRNMQALQTCGVRCLRRFAIKRLCWASPDKECFLIHIWTQNRTTGKVSLSRQFGQ